MKKSLYDRFIRPIFTINDTPHAVALGVSMGVFIGLTPTVGYQMLLVVLIGTLIRANRIVAVLVTWISNPVTAVPLYYAYYWFGCKVLGVELWTFSTFAPKIQGIWEGNSTAGFWSRVAEIFSNLASDIGAPLFLGSLIIATLIALPLYPVVHIMLKRHQSENGRALKPGKPAGAGETIQDKKKGKDGKPGLIKSDSGEAIQDSQSLKIP